MATRLAIQLVAFWSKRGELSEARELLERLRGLHERSSHRVSPELQVQALASLAAAVWHQGDSVQAHTLFEQCLALARDCTAPAILSWSLDVLGYVALVHGDYERVMALQHEAMVLAGQTGDVFGPDNAPVSNGRDGTDDAMALAWQIGDRRATTRALTRLGDVARARGEVEQVRVYCEESLTLSRALGERHLEGYALNNLGFAALLEGDMQQAMARFTSSLALFRELDLAAGVAEVLTNVGRLARVQGNLEKAQAALVESLTLASAGGPETVVPDALEELAGLATVQRQAARAARLFGAAQALRDARCLARWPINQARHDRDVSDVRALLGADVFVPA